MSATPERIRPRCNPLLWSNLRPPRPTADDHRPTLDTPVLLPENRSNASLRVILHDTKAVLEQFSGRLQTLTTGIAEANQHISNANAHFDNAHDKTLDELVSTVNRTQKGLLDVIGSPAQAVVLEQITQSHASLQEKLGFMLQQLQAVTEQQGHILLALASITPLSVLLKDVPHHQSQMLNALLPLHTLPEHLNTIHTDLSTALKNNTEAIHALLANAQANVNAAASHPTHTPQTNVNSSRPHVASSDPIQNDTPPLHKRTLEILPLQASTEKRPRLEQTPSRTASIDRRQPLLTSRTRSKLSYQKDSLPPASTPVQPSSRTVPTRRIRPPTITDPFAQSSSVSSSVSRNKNDPSHPASAHSDVRHLRTTSAVRPPSDMPQRQQFQKEKIHSEPQKRTLLLDDEEHDGDDDDDARKNVEILDWPWGDM